MALSFSSPFTWHCSLSPPSSSALALPVTATPISRLHMKPSAVHTKSLNGFSFHIHSITSKRDAMIVKVSSDIDVTGPDGDQPKSESSDDEENLPFDKLPLESKLQLKLEQKMKMKLAKKTRLRRKRLVRKRRMRKKGRWPPSKMKKLKNV